MQHLTQTFLTFPTSDSRITIFTNIWQLPFQSLRFSPYSFPVNVHVGQEYMLSLFFSYSFLLCTLYEMILSALTVSTTNCLLMNPRSLSLPPTFLLNSYTNGNCQLYTYTCVFHNPLETSGAKLSCFLHQTFYFLHILLSTFYTFPVFMKDTNYQTICPKGKDSALLLCLTPHLTSQSMPFILWS